LVNETGGAANQRLEELDTHGNQIGEHVRTKHYENGDNCGQNNAVSTLQIGMSPSFPIDLVRRHRSDHNALGIDHFVHDTTTEFAEQISTRLRCSGSAVIL
jgi:hypothetical protein